MTTEANSKVLEFLRERRAQLKTDAIQLLQKIAHEFETDPVVVQCFDRELVQSVIAVAKLYRNTIVLRKRSDHSPQSPDTQ